jgi:hypothetical protein
VPKQEGHTEMTNSEEGGGLGRDHAAMALLEEIAGVAGKS